MAKFCAKCGQKLPDAVMNFISKSKTHEFEDGFYCEKCATIRVQEARG